MSTLLNTSSLEQDNQSPINVEGIPVDCDVLFNQYTYLLTPLHGQDVT